MTFWGLVLSCLLAAAAVPAWSSVDAAGSRDPLEIPRFPFSSIDTYRFEQQHLPRDFAVGRVDKGGREVRLDRKVRTNATLESATYRIPDGTPVEDVAAHYLSLLGAGQLFSCRGRDCGRSNYWANDVFNEAGLYGPDGNQFYLAAQYREQLVGVYVIERGNKRVYAHVEVFRPDAPVTVGGNQLLAERLAADGFVRIEGLEPARDGGLPGDANSVLQAVAQRLEMFAGRTVYVVCHIHGPEPTPVLLQSAATCGQSVVEELTTAAGDRPRPELVAFAAGPLLPREGAPASRVELVLPHRPPRD